MLGVPLCARVTILPGYLFRRYGQGKRIGKEITLYSVRYVLRYGITACFILTISLITVVFYFHPSTSNVVVHFRTVPIIPDVSGRVVEVYRGVSDKASAGDPLFRLDTERQEAQAEIERRKIAETDAAMVVARSDLASTDAKVTEARAALQQVHDELDTKRASGAAVSRREIETLEISVVAAEGALAAAEAAPSSARERLETLPPAQNATAEAALRRAQIENATIRAGVDGQVEQFTLRKRVMLHAMDALGPVHAMLLRIQVAMMPFRTLVFSGWH